MSIETRYWRWSEGPGRGRSFGHTQSHRCTSHQQLITSKIQPVSSKRAITITDMDIISGRSTERFRCLIVETTKWATCSMMTMSMLVMSCKYITRYMNVSPSSSMDGKKRGLSQRMCFVCHGKLKGSWSLVISISPSSQCVKWSLVVPFLSLLFVSMSLCYKQVCVTKFPSVVFVIFWFS